MTFLVYTHTAVISSLTGGRLKSNGNILIVLQKPLRAVVPLFGFVGMALEKLQPSQDIDSSRKQIHEPSI